MPAATCSVPSDRMPRHDLLRPLSLSLASVLLSACNIGVIPRDMPPPEPAPTDSAAQPEQPSQPAPSQVPSNVSFKLDGNRLELPGPIVFQTGTATLDPASDPALEHIRLYLAEKTALSTLRIEGHADDQTLSEQRASAVVLWLRSHGAECNRLVAVGFGPNKPIADASTPEGKAQNTRIEAHNAALLGRQIGGLPVDGGGGRLVPQACQ